MKLIIITDKDIDEVIAVFTERKFIDEVNKEYWEANDFCGDREYFKIKHIDLAIDWYVITSDNLKIDYKEIEFADDEELTIRFLDRG